MANAKKRIKPVIEEVVEEEPKKQVEEVDKVVQVEEPPEKVEEARLPTGQVEESGNKISIRTILVITIISALVAAFVSGGVYVYLTGVSGMKKQVVEEPSPVPTQVPTPEPSEEAPIEKLDLKSYKIQVLNGSGQIGAAGAGKDVVEGAGFTVTTTGNASSYNYKETVIQTKDGVPEEAIDKLREALEAKYEVKLGEALLENNKYDIVVTVGTK